MEAKGKSIRLGAIIIGLLFLFMPSADAHFKVADIFLYPNYKVHFPVQPGDSLRSILKSHCSDSNSATSGEINSILNLFNQGYPRQSLRAGYYFTIEKSYTNKLVGISLSLSKHERVKISRKDEADFVLTKSNPELQTRLIRAADSIYDNLFASAASSGLSHSLIMNLVSIYQNYGIDLSYDIKPGAKFEVLFERLIDEKNDPIMDSHILFASLEAAKKNIDLYRYQSESSNKVFYFNEEGVSAQRLFFSLPVANAKISSPFGKRTHPIYGHTKFHKGIDIVAKVGTAIHAPADGVVEYVGVKSGYGKYLKLRHDKQYSTVYAHMDKHYPGLKPGSIIKKQQVIGYVGKTGKVTGPHLHYEVIYRGKNIDPITANKRQNVQILPPEEHKILQASIENIKSNLGSLPYANELIMAMSK